VADLRRMVLSAYALPVDLLTFARNARTSVEMIEKFYASELSAEMNLGLLQSGR